jgi:hypothetical protein
MIHIQLNQAEAELITRALRVLAVALADSHPAQADNCNYLREEIQEEL